MSELEDLIENTCSPEEVKRRIEDAKAYFARMKPEEWRQKQADAQTLADVRTLSEYVKKLGLHYGWTLSTYNGGAWGVVFTNKCWEETTGAPCLEGPEPEGALHKAAEWVRKQAATTTEGLK